MLAALHLAVPWVLRRPRGRDPLRRLARAARARAERVYPAATIGLGFLALLFTDTGFPELGSPWPLLVAGAAAGVGFPLLMAAVVHRPRRIARFPARAAGTALCAAAEEALWRLAALGGLVHSGLPLPLAAALSLAGFALLHVPRNGWRVVYYQLLFGAVLTALALIGGVVAAALCHAAHNLVLGATSRRPRRPAAAVPNGLPPSRAWGSPT
ncbi:CPBP family glutamic-type intramembrane protease [Streptomonospora salina]|uniref:CAAX prenyl protease 2/Lysostaphin resistance protein A-like domain-containing protein n=1 Tax=Streptomonospora salina TaxID=104205 RepID=A0A841E6E3_9ACTN|nr:CPBP family glutamic-type intramembrane protease [Streptomonospora salina]MBB5998372.1 hypothetical protein [Streptomonospora salina]